MARKKVVRYSLKDLRKLLHEAQADVDRAKQEDLDGAHVPSMKPDDLSDLESDIGDVWMAFDTAFRSLDRVCNAVNSEWGIRMREDREKERVKRKMRRHATSRGK